MSSPKSISSRIVSPNKKSPGQPRKSPKPEVDKKGYVSELSTEEEELLVPVPEGVMHRRMRFLLETKLKTDVDFVVGPDHAQSTISAHKCMLTAESPIFEKLFTECDEWKLTRIKEREEEARKLREEEREIELAIQNAGAVKSKNSPDKAEQKGSPPRGNPDKKSPDKNSSDKKSPKGSPKKSPKSKSASKGELPRKGSPSKEGQTNPKAGTNSPTASAEAVVDFYKDIVVGTDTIRVQDVHPLGFYRLLRYIYYDEMVFTGVVGTLRTLYAARKYCFYDLARACVNYLENNVCIEHVLKLLKASFDFNEPRLRNLCMRLIINDTFEVLKREEFKDVHRDLIVQILHQDVLNIREIELFDQVMHWAENECERIGIPVTAMNQRIALGNHNFAKIRFPTILPHEFATHIVESGTLKTDEIISILQYHITGRKPNVPFSCKARRRPCLDLSPLDNASITFSEQTDITFLVYTGNPRRAHSFRDIYVPVGIVPPVKTVLIRERERTGSPPGRFHLTDDEFDEVDANIKHLARLYSERQHFEFSKQHLALMRTHYK
ncbi:BTB/POZ domain-containing protein 3/6 [Paragonimus westermani]|uniref:BTB/POZ domain-containing protein 3/6 n=1 Tax=Paragonimus westermani TaxID=34504 RepID=A0A5J4NHZ4_9TREM|nr:BTB/POZ domain-containing protein 3/6 [Paragonimus westermani]